MNKLSALEEKVLGLINKDNFRGISKENIMQLASVLEKGDPEVKKAVIAQSPELFKALSGIMVKGIESCETSTLSYFQGEDEIIMRLQNEIEKEDTTFEQKQFYFEKMAEASERKAKKESEHKKTIFSFLKYGAGAIFGFVVLMIYISKETPASRM